MVALILGEASPFEAEESERMMKERPELRVSKRPLEVMHSLMGEAVRPPDAEKWRLAPERRAEVMQALGIEAPEEPAVVSIDTGRERRVLRAGVRVAMMAAACLLISVVLAPFLLRGTKSEWANVGAKMESEDSVIYHVRKPGRPEVQQPALVLHATRSFPESTLQ